MDEMRVSFPSSPAHYKSRDSEICQHVQLTPEQCCISKMKHATNSYIDSKDILHWKDTIGIVSPEACAPRRA